MMNSINNSLAQNGCKQCSGTGWIFSYKPASDFYGMEAGEQLIEFVSKCPTCSGGHAVVEQRKQRAQLPASYYDAEFPDFDWLAYKDYNGNQIDCSKQQKFATSFVKDFAEWSANGIGLYIWSATKGSGKTYLASCICNTLIKEQHIKPKFVNCLDLVIMDKSADTDKYATAYEKDPIRELCDCDLLVIDDLGKSHGDSWLQDIVYRIANDRMQRKKPMIVTSNTKIANLPFNDKVKDRLNKMQQLPLPDCCVREKEFQDEKITLYRKLGLTRSEAKQTEQMRIERL